MRDMKYEMYLIAENIAYERYGCCFYQLSNELREKVWREAEEEWSERECDFADRLIDAFKIEGKFTWVPRRRLKIDL